MSDDKAGTTGYRQCRFTRSDQEVLGLLRERIIDAAVTVEGDFGYSKLSVQGDRIMLQQVIMNLVSNPLEAISQNGAREKRIEILTGKDAELNVWVSARDTGFGFSEETAQSLFDTLTTTKRTGMGMGLSICRSIVVAHGGRIEARPSHPYGAYFRFAIPPGGGKSV